MTSRKTIWTGKYDEEQLKLYAAREAYGYRKYKPEATREECEEYGREMAEHYRHHFRIWA